MHRPRPHPFRSSPSRPQARPSSQLLGQFLQRAGITLNATGLEQLWHYHNLIRKRNDDRDLTRIVNFDAVVTKHYVDCLIVGKFITLASPLLDIGTGAGFPSVPLKIRYPHLEIIAAEHRPRRVEFLREVSRELGLSRFHVFEHKVVSQSFQRPVKAVITRALETMDKTLLRTSACLGVGGLLYFMKGPNADEELEVLGRRFAGHFRVIEDRRYTLPGTTYDRRLVVVEKLVPVQKE